MRKAVMILLALLAIRLLPRALRREAAALQLITLLCELLAATITATSKATGTEARTASLEVRTGTLSTRLGNLAGQQTTQNGLPNGAITGQTDRNSLSNGNIVGYSGPQIGGASAHIHGASGGGNAYSVSDSTHVHTFGSAQASVANGQHSHGLPAV